MSNNFAPSWSPQEDEILRSLRDNCTNKEISEALKQKGWVRSQEAVRKRSRVLGLRFLEQSKTSSSLASIIETIRQQDPLPQPEVPIPSSQKAALTTAKKNATNKLFEQLREIREEVDRWDRWPAIDLTRGKDAESLVLLLSDFHVGKVITDPDNNTVFNIEIAQQRIDAIRGKVWRIVAENPRVNEVVIILAGDLVDGEGIYPGQEMHLESHVADQIKAVTTSLWKLITDLHKLYAVRVVTCRGNHGRTNLSDEANWDNIIYQQLELLSDMQASETLQVKNLYGNYNTFAVKGWKGLIRHSAPMQADTGAAIAKFAGWHNIHQYDFLCYGHWHHWGVMTWNGHPLFRNGSLGGGDEYAEGFGAYDYPTQLAFITSEEELVKSVIPIRFE